MRKASVAPCASTAARIAAILLSSGAASVETDLGGHGVAGVFTAPAAGPFTPEDCPDSEEGGTHPDAGAEL